MNVELQLLLLYKHNPSPLATPTTISSSTTNTKNVQKEQHVMVGIQVESRIVSSIVEFYGSTIITIILVEKLREQATRPLSRSVRSSL